MGCFCDASISHDGYPTDIWGILFIGREYFSRDVSWTFQGFPYPETIPFWHPRDIFFSHLGSKWDVPGLIPCYSDRPRIVTQLPFIHRSERRVSLEVEFWCLHIVRKWKTNVDYASVLGSRLAGRLRKESTAVDSCGCVRIKAKQLLVIQWVNNISITPKCSIFFLGLY